VDDLLGVTRIANGKLQVERRSMDLRDLAQRTAEDHRNLFAAREVALEVALPDAPLWVEGDATRLAQAIGNLLQNSAKFTSSGDSVRLSLEAVDGFAVLRVRDTGVGIDPAMIRASSSPFSQADTTLNRRLGGLGLGLALVKGARRDAPRHHRRVEAAARARAPSSSCGCRSRRRRRGSRSHRRPAPRPRRILVIEDNLDAAESLRLALELEGHEVAIAHDGPQGIKRARELTGSRALRHRAPDMDGYAVAKASATSLASGTLSWSRSPVMRFRRTSGAPPRPGSTRT
jgi:two-component system CheB/CheR fusion protein